MKIYHQQAGHGRQIYFDEQNMEYLFTDHKTDEYEYKEAERAAIAMSSPSIQVLSNIFSMDSPNDWRSRKKPKWNADQEQTPQCTPYSALINLLYTPNGQKKLLQLILKTGKEVPERLYRFFQSIDREEGRYFAEGCTMLSIGKGLKRLEWIKAYYWEYSTTGFVAASRKKAVLLGIDWPELCNDPDPVHHTIRFYGPVEGGHAICSPYMTASERAATLHQSWGEENYGDRGLVTMPIRDVGIALANYGEVLILDEVDEIDPSNLMSMAL
jgi:hypothetical protein